MLIRVLYRSIVIFDLWTYYCTNVRCGFHFMFGHRLVEPFLGECCGKSCMWIPSEATRVMSLIALHRFFLNSFPHVKVGYYQLVRTHER